MLSPCQRAYRVLQFQMFTFFVAVCALSLCGRGAAAAPPLAVRAAHVSPPAPAAGGAEQCELALELRYDLRPAFAFTTKQVYLSVVAAWEDGHGPQEQTVWDRTVFHSDDALKAFSGVVFAKYPLRGSPGLRLGGQRVALRFVVHEVGFGGLFRQTALESGETFTVPRIESP